MSSEPANTVTGAAPQSNVVSPQPTSSGKLLLPKLIVAALLSAALATVLVRSVGHVFKLPPELAALGFGRIPGPEEQVKLAAGNAVIRYKHSVLWMAMIGFVLGTGLAIARADQIRGVVKSVIGAALAGSVLAAIAGPVATRIDLSLGKNLAPEAFSLADAAPLGMHALTWAMVGFGIAAGMMFGATGSRKAKLEQCVISLLGGAVGGALFPFAGALFVPELNSGYAIPEFEPSTGIFLWIALPTVLIALVSARELTPKSASV